MMKNLLRTMLVGVCMLAGAGEVMAEETTKSYTSTESAYIDQSNADINYNGASLTQLSVYSSQYRDWGNNDGQIKFGTNGKVAFYKFNLTDIKALTGNITKAIFKFEATSSDTSKGSSKIRALGYNADWDAASITYSNASNKSGSITGDVNATGSYQPLGTTTEYSCKTTTTLEADALAYLKSAINANASYISFAIAVNHQRTLYVGTTATLEIVTVPADQTSYTVKFQDESGNTLKDDVTYDCKTGDVVTASETDMADIYNSDKTKKYVYNSGNRSITATADGNTITLVFKEMSPITVSVSAVDENDNILQENIGSASGFEGETLIAYYSKYIKIDNQWYVTETKKTEPFLGISATETTTAKVTYTPSNIIYFIEAENMSLSKSNAWAAETDVPKRFSNGKGYRFYKNSYAYTEPLTGGTYNLTIFSRHTKTSSQTLSLYIRSTDGTLTDLGMDYVTNSGTSEHDAGIVTIPDGYSLVLYNDNDYNSNVLLDYIYLSPATYTVSTTEVGLATLAPPYGLNFESATKVAAYMASSVGDDVISLKKVTNVAAGEGVLIRSLTGDATEEEIAIDASITTKNDGNKFVGVLEDTNITSGYVLNSVDGDVSFYAADATNGTTVGANKAYLPATSSAKSLKITFDGETTGINEIGAVKASKSEAIFNLSGQRIAQPAKGLYIMNGKKVIVK